MVRNTNTEVRVKRVDLFNIAEDLRSMSDTLARYGTLDVWKPNAGPDAAMRAMTTNARVLETLANARVTLRCKKCNDTGRIHTPVHADGHPNVVGSDVDYCRCRKGRRLEAKEQVAHDEAYSRNMR